MLLTLLSIVQALTLELLWAHITTNGDLYRLSWTAALCWTQIVANLLGVLLIWLVYAGMTMRFRWVPSTGDSVFPFLIGILQFMLVETLGPTLFGWWFLLLALVFAIMAWVSQTTLRRARLDGDNDAYFSTISPATRRDHYPAILTVAAIAATGAYLAATGNQGWIAMIGLLGAVAALIIQLRIVTIFWNRTFAITQ
ncbi:MAG: hypothetical protein HC809_12275 [Gammaproteobacteria bacterium]|nr:hypothetical protein [Gammaproteobacteria bacterium]